MVIANIHEAKTQLSRLIEKALAGEEVIISRAGAPVVKLVPCAHSKEARRPGLWKGRVSMSPDFDDLPPEIARAFQGDE